MELPFKESKECSIGIELELQIINDKNFDLASSSLPMIEHLKKINCPGQIVPEVTQSMIEFNSSIHDNIHSLHEELKQFKASSIDAAKLLHVRLAGGATHPFQRWQERKITPIPRYRKIGKVYGFLLKQFTIFGQHIHIGCLNGEEAIYLTHGLARYLPHFIALSASSPFYQEVDTHFNSVRTGIMHTLPTSGFLPEYIANWNTFSHFFDMMHAMNIVHSMKDFYWDIRPKPEFGTVELRACDMPLDIEKVTLLAAYAQTLAHYLFHTRTATKPEHTYLVFHFNRFQAARFGFRGRFIDPTTQKSTSVTEDILHTLKEIKPFAKKLGNQAFIDNIYNLTQKKQNDSRWLRQVYKKVKSLPQLVYEQTRRWMGD